MRLPYELLQQIFIEAWKARSSATSLLLTCRVWYRIASTTSILWSRLYLGARENFVSQPDKVCCASLSSLTKALTRIGEIPFELSIDCRGQALDSREAEKFTQTVDAAWLSRCRSLVWLHMSALVGWHHFLELFSSADYSSLDVLEVWSMTGPISVELGSFMASIEATAINIRSVTIVSHTSDWGFIRLRQYSQLLDRLEHLRMATPQDSTWDGLTSLEHLELVNTGAKLYLPSAKNLRRVFIQGTGNITVLGPEIYSQLTDITIQSNHYWWIQYPRDKPTIRLPALTHLEIRGTLLSLPPIDAPQLFQVTLLYSSISRRYTLLPPKIPKLCPQIFIMDKPSGDPELVKVLEHIWDGLEELQITLLRPSDSLGTKFIRALCGPPAPMFPQLRPLTVLCRLREEPSQTQTQTPSVIQTLQKIIAGLEPRGHLRRVRCGWHNNNVVPFASELRQDWDIFWQDLL